MRRAIVGLILVCAACGGGSDGTPSRATGPTGGNQPPGGVTPTIGAVVNIQEYSYSPPTISIKAGQAVQWTNSGTVAHTVTGGGFASGQLAAPGASGYGGMSTGDTYQATFTVPGTIDYHCANHPQMMGTIIVSP